MKLRRFIKHGKDIIFISAVLLLGVYIYESRNPIDGLDEDLANRPPIKSIKKVQNVKNPSSREGVANIDNHQNGKNTFSLQQIAKNNKIQYSHPTDTQGHLACLNKDFKATRTISLWTMLSDSKNYIEGVIKLGISVLRHSTIPIDLVVMELSNKPLSEEHKINLHKVGWNICTVERIKPRDEARTYPRFRDQFTKLHLWNMTSYKSVVYLDSDTLVVGNIDKLLSMDLNSSKIGVTRDIRDGVWQKTFNMGVFLIHPNEAEFNRLMLNKNDPRVKFETTMSEQGFLNVVYANQWHEIGFIYNANLAAYSQTRKYWDEYENNIKIIHYTMEKPWNCGRTYFDVCEIWRKAPPISKQVTKSQIFNWW